jgi:hypothetical protein
LTGPLIYHTEHESLQWFYSAWTWVPLPKASRVTVCVQILQSWVPCPTSYVSRQDFVSYFSSYFFPLWQFKVLHC